MKASASGRKIRALTKTLPRAVLGLLALGFLFGCGARRKEITELQRKEAAHLDSEAQFAITLRQWERAEGLYAKTVQLCPDTGTYWASLGAMRVRLGRRDAAKDAYQRALKAFAAEAERDKTQLDPWLKQVEVLALLGRVEEGRAMLEKARQRFPNDRALRGFIENKSLDQMIADPLFKQSAL